MNPPTVLPTVDGMIASSCRCRRATASIVTNEAPASAVSRPSPTASTLVPRVVSMTRPPASGIDWP
jgi:hypothetical protein